MNKMKSFLKMSCLTVIIAVIVFFTALIYRANEESYVKTYMFQMDNSPRRRIGALKDLKKINPQDLLNKLIHEYVSEYFRVIPSDPDIMSRTIITKLSYPEAFKIWSETEAKTINKMSAEKMFRLVEFPENSIEAMNKPSGYDYLPDQIVKPVYYAVHYDTVTWTEPNAMDTQPVREHGTLYIEVNFKPGIWPHMNVPQELIQGTNPVELFEFKVSNIGNKGI
ncbi:MAG: hypothetical protein IKN73_04175 [Alphaproteobacteria bacterium]|nr:hypothetical protein [Alphaproteobacteria bacterium]